MVALATCVTDELGLPTESDLARRLVLRGFPKVKPTWVRGSSQVARETTFMEEKNVKLGPYKSPACLSDRVRYMRVAPIELCSDERSVRKKGHL